MTDCSKQLSAKPQRVKADRRNHNFIISIIQDLPTPSSFAKYPDTLCSSVIEGGVSMPFWK
jgi:hypothetical protein